MLEEDLDRYSLPAARPFSSRATYPARYWWYSFADMPSNITKSRHAAEKHVAAGVHSDTGQDERMVYALASVAPTGDGIRIEYGKASATAAVQSVVIVPGLLNPTPLALIMEPAAPQSDPDAVYTYSFVPWNLTAGVAADGAKVAGTWTSTIYNSFHATAAGGGAVYAAGVQAKSGAEESEESKGTSRSTGRTHTTLKMAETTIIKVDLLTGNVAYLSMSGLVGVVQDLLYIEA